LQALEADRFEVVIDRRIDRRRGGRMAGLDLLHRLHCRGGDERRSAGEEMIKRRAQRIDIRGGTDQHVLRRRKSTGQDHLQSDLAFGLQLMRAIHHPHAAAGNFAQQFVVPKATQPHATQRLRLAAILIMEKAEWCLQWGSLDWAAFLPAREQSLSSK